MGLTIDELYFVGALLTSYALSLASGYLQNLPTPKRLSETILHLLQFLPGILLTTFAFGYAAAGLVLAVAIGVWVWQRFARRFISTFAHGAVIWVFMFASTVYLHVTRPLHLPVHVSGCIMLMTIKYTSHTRVGNGVRDRGDASDLLSWLGWTYFLPSYFAGPVLSYSEYMDWAYTRQPPTPPANPMQDITPKLRKTVEVFRQVFWLLPFALIGPDMFPASSVTNFPAEMSMLSRITYCWVAFWCIRCRYYLVWSLTEAAYIASRGSQYVWHRGCATDVLKIELAPNSSVLLREWNRATALWLKLHVYQPVLEWLSGGNSFGVRLSAWVSPTIAAVLTTNMTSAMWHGFSPGYYMTFLGAGASAVVSRMLYHHVEPYTKQSEAINTAYNVLQFVWLHIVLLTFGFSFHLSSFAAAWKAWEQIFFIGHIWIGAATILVLVCRLQFSNPGRQAQYQALQQNAQREKLE